jgi:tellurite methyltransferase
MTVKYDKHYAASDKACGEAFEPIVSFARELTPQARVLDLGCGQGRDAVLFARLGHRVVGVDVSSVGVEQLNAIAEREGLSIEAEVGDVVSYTPTGRFDVVLLDRVLHMLSSDDDRRVVLNKGCAATAASGHLLISEYPKQRDMLAAYFGLRPDWTVRLERKGFLFVQRGAEPSPE